MNEKVNANDVIAAYQKQVSDLEFQNIVLKLQLKKLKATKPTKAGKKG